jgi:hypothetical protein
MDREPAYGLQPAGAEFRLGYSMVEEVCIFATPRYRTACLLYRYTCALPKNHFDVSRSLLNPAAYPLLKKKTTDMRKRGSYGY